MPVKFPIQLKFIYLIENIMNIRPVRHEYEEPEINLTSLIDVVLLLLIFFMVSTSFIHQPGLKVDLPEATAQPLEQEGNPLRVSIDKKGRVAVNGQRLADSQPATLMVAMKKAAGDSKQPQVIISADAKTDYQAVVAAMDAAQRLGFVRINLVTEQRQSNS